MDFLRDSDLASLQAVAGLLRRTPCQILRKTSVSDGMGGATDSWSLVSDPGLMCRVSYSQQVQETISEGRLETESRWAIALPPNQDVSPPDRIVAQSLNYEVVDVTGPGSFEIERIAFCELVQ